MWWPDIASNEIRLPIMFKQINKYDFYENIFHGEEQKFDEVEKQKMSQLFTVKTYEIFN